MNEIYYALVTDDYEGRVVEGFVESEEEAMKICYLYNMTTDEPFDMRYEPVSQYSKFTQEELAKINKKYNYVVRAWLEKDGWKFDKPNEIKVKMAESWEKERWEVNTWEMGFYPERKPEVFIYLTLATVDREKALKIAQDMLYKKLAEKEGL